MSNEITPDEPATISAEVNRIQIQGRTLNVNQHALNNLRGYIREYLSQLVFEADRRARLRGGNDIQSGDIDGAKRYLDGKAKGHYWAVFLGSGFFGAGLQGIVDAVVSNKGTPSIILYASFIILGLLLVYYGAPRR